MTGVQTCLFRSDADGIIAIPQDELESLMPKVQAHLTKEASIRAINASQGGNPERVRAMLQAKGVPV